MKVLITSSSFITSSGSHHKRLDDLNIIKLPGPLSENQLLEKLETIKNLDGYICGDDEITKNVLLKLKEFGINKISKYGVGLDKIDLEYAKKIKISVLNCFGINSSTVAEHALSLLLFWAKKYKENILMNGFRTWERAISKDIKGLKGGLVGLGSTGYDTAKLYSSLGVKIKYFDPFVNKNEFKKINKLDELNKCDFISIHAPYNKKTNSLVDMSFFKKFNGNLIINMSRANLIDEESLKKWLSNNKLNCLYTDVLYEEPPSKNNWMLNNDQIIITPHVGSRSKECIERTANKALDNLLNI